MDWNTIAPFEAECRRLHRRHRGQIDGGAELEGVPRHSRGQRHGAFKYGCRGVVRGPFLTLVSGEQGQMERNTVDMNLQYLNIALVTLHFKPQETEICEIEQLRPEDFGRQSLGPGNAPVGERPIFTSLTKAFVATSAIRPTRVTCMPQICDIITQFFA
jgi:hypothetical protein